MILGLVKMFMTLCLLLIFFHHFYEQFSSYLIRKEANKYNSTNWQLACRNNFLLLNDLRLLS
jgi:hypothetical protein